MVGAVYLKQLKMYRTEEGFGSSLKYTVQTRLRTNKSLGEIIAGQGKKMNEKIKQWVSLVNTKQNQIKLLYEYSEAKPISGKCLLYCYGNSFDLCVIHNVMLQVIASVIRAPKPH